MSQTSSKLHRNVMEESSFIDSCRITASTGVNNQTRRQMMNNSNGFNIVQQRSSIWLTLATITINLMILSTTTPVKAASIESFRMAAPSMPQTSPNVDGMTLEQQMIGRPGQKETEQVMNPNEIMIDGTESSIDSLYGSSPDLEAELDSDTAVAAAIGDIDNELMAKRGKWNSLQSGWGKRAANNWNKLSAAWGKRRTPNAVNGWNNLSGMWGKKRAKWNELSGMWGKRSWNDMAGGWGKRKRSSSPHWNKLRGMWGKRSNISPLFSSSDPNGPNH
ncbi:hypothetical protein BLOT_013196 [Blomia tropicalis]|nr:hypothetical protein BLOT_013196 [Blomia tropicalis]